jgi:hypothetical protein
LGFYHDVIDVNLKVTPYLLFEAKMHALLICTPPSHVLQFIRHFYVAKAAERSDERGGGLVHLGEGYLVKTRVSIQENQELTPGCEINNLVYAGKRKRILQTCVVQARVVKAHPPFPILFLYKNRICYPAWVLDFFDEASC